MADLRPLAPTLTYGLPASVTTESRGAIGAVALDWRRALGDSVTTRTLEQRDLHPFARAHRAGERDLTRGLASGTQYVAGSGPPEPLSRSVSPTCSTLSHSSSTSRDSQGDSQPARAAGPPWPHTAGRGADVAVDLHRRRALRVTQQLLGDPRMDARADEEARRSMAEVVEPHPGQPGALEERLEVLNRARIDERASHRPVWR
jgi:hypothetical protein